MHDRDPQPEDLSPDSPNEIHERDDQLRDAALADDRELYKAVHAARLEVSMGSIARAQSASEAARNAAAAIGTLYTGILGVAFAVDEGQSLPARRVIPAFFLGIALVCATAYGALLRPGTPTRVVASRGTLRSQQEARVQTFTRWTTEIAGRNAWSLYAAVFSLGAGVMTLPLAFLDWRGAGPWLSAGALGIAVFVGTLIAVRTWHPRRRGAPPARESTEPPQR